MEDKICKMCSYYIEGSTECEKNNRMWVICENYSELKLKAENEKHTIVDVILNRKELPIKIKIKREVDFQEMLDFLPMSEWYKIMHNHYEKIKAQSGININFEEKCLNPLINKLHTLVQWYQDKGWLDFTLFKSNNDDWIFIKEYFKINWIRGEINLPELNFSYKNISRKIEGYTNNDGWTGLQPVYSKEGWY